jgi:hypothetical protein
LAPIRFRSVIPSREQERAANFSFGLVFVTAGKVKLLIVVAVCVVLGSRTSSRSCFLDIGSKTSFLVSCRAFIVVSSSHTRDDR